MLSRLAVLIVQTGVIGLITMGLLELLVVASLMAPQLSLLPRPLLQYLYINVDRRTIQVMPGTTFTPGTSFLGVELVGWLEMLDRRANSPQRKLAA